MKKIISVLMSIVIMAVTVEREVIEAFAVDQAQIKGIQMGYVGTECIQIKAEVGGNKAGYKYKFVWLERSRLGRDWGVQNVNWGVIREFGETDTVKWKAPRMPADYEIYMDVMDSKRDIKTIHKSFYGLSGLRKVSKEQIKGIEIGINGEALKIRAVMEGERRWYKYKFVWLEGSRAGGNWGVRNVNWGVIREFGFADTVMWKPPKMPKDYVIYMDVMDAHGTHIDGYNRYYEGEIIKTRQEVEQSERMRKELETKVNQARQRAAQQEKEIREIENQVARVKREFAESERKRKEVAGKLEESKRKAEEFERSKKELEVRLSKAKQELEEREKRKKELQRKVDQEKQTVEKNKKVQKENQSRRGEIKEQLEKEKQRTKSLEEELQEVKKRVEEEEKRQKIRRENERKERKAEEQKEESKEEKIIWESRGSPGNIIEGGYYSQEDGHWIEDETIESSCLIPVEESRGYTATQIDGDVTWWDTEKRLIGKTSKEKFKQKGYVTAPKGAKYARYVFGAKTEPKRVIRIAEKKPEVEYTLLKKEEKKKTPETLSKESTVRAEDLCKANPEYSKYEKYIKEITEELSNKNSKVGKEALSSRDTSLETITKKLKYVCCRMSQEKRVTAYPVQILATMKLVESVLSGEPGMKGSVGDIKTGEGKSLVVTLTAIILQSYGRKVDIVTPNMELATRDWRESKKYYELFGITSGFLYDKVKDSEFKDAENESEESKEDYKAEYNYEVLSRGIVYTTGSNMQWMYLKSTFSAEELRSREYDVCIADEVDNLLIDGATTPALISSNFPTKQVEKIQERVYQSALAGKNADEIKGILQGEFKESRVSDEELALMMRAVEVSQKAENGKDYVLEKDEYGRTRVLIIDRNTGFPLKLSRWHAYVHEMIEIKEGIVSQPTSVTKCAISPMIFFGAYKNLLGVTGTVGGKREEEIFRRIYRLSTFKVPTHREVKRDVTIRIYNPEEENLNDLIAKEALEKSKKGRPVLVIMDSINATNELKEKYLKDANLIQGIDVQRDRNSIENAGRSGMITISTVVAGRGTNVLLEDDSIRAGGLHVIVSKLPSQGRTLVQNIGRSSRQGQPGSAIIYVKPGDKFDESPEMNPSVVNLFRLQRKFEKYLSESWPWLNAKTSVFTSESEYRFGTDYDEILRTDAGIIVDKFFWPKKVLTQSEYQECLDLTKNMVLTAWGRLYTHLSTSEKSRDMSYCDQKYDEFLSALNKWMPAGCPGPKEYIGRWARDLGKDKEIFDFLYSRREGMTIRDFLTELFKYKRVQLHAMKAGHDISSFESMLKFMPEEHQRAYAELVAEEESYRRRVADYNAKVAAYNQRKAERERIEKENAQVYTRTVERTVEADEIPEAPAEAPSEQEEQLDEQPEESKSAARRVLEQVGNTLEKAKDLAGKVFGEIADHEETTARTMSTGMSAEKPVKSMLARPGTKVAKGTPAHSDAKVVKTCGGFQAPLMVFSDFYEKQMVEDPPVNRGSAPTPAPEPDSEPEAETEQTEEMPKEQTVTEVETYRMPQIPLPDELPRPGVPKKPSWWEIGWRRLMGRSVNDMIWDRWYPPEQSNYAELVCPCREYVYLGEINEEELNRLNFELKELSSMMVDSQDEDTQNEVEVRVAINRGTSGGIKVLSGTIMIVGSVAGITAVAASGGTALPVVVMALGTAMIMFGASDTIEGIGDIQAAISRQGLDQMSYNPVRESVFGGNETAYTLTEMGVSFVFDVITGMAIAKMPTRLKTPAQAFRATSAAGKAGAAVEATEESSKMVRVGRWMSRAEYDKMVKTGRVQMSPNGNRSYVAYPADINAFGKQAKPGSIYVEYDVDVSVLRNGGSELWAQIPGPDSLLDRYDRYRGLQGISEMPLVKNIEIKGSK